MYINRQYCNSHKAAGVKQIVSDMCVAASGTTVGPWMSGPTITLRSIWPMYFVRCSIASKLWRRSRGRNLTAVINAVFKSKFITCKMWSFVDSEFSALVCIGLLVVVLVSSPFEHNGVLLRRSISTWAVTAFIVQLLLCDLRLGLKIVFLVCILFVQLQLIIGLGLGHNQTIEEYGRAVLSVILLILTLLLHKPAQVYAHGIHSVCVQCGLVVYWRKTSHQKKTTVHQTARRTPTLTGTTPDGLRHRHPHLKLMF